MPKLPTYRNQSIDLQSKSIDWFLYDGNFSVLCANGAISGMRIAGNQKPFKNDEKCFLFHVKSYFCLQDTQIFVLRFLVM